MKSKQTVVLPEQTVRDIQQIAMDRKEPVLGSVQRTLARGAELALAELRGNPPYKEENCVGENQSSIVNTKIDGYNSLHVVEAARRVAKSLAELAVDLETAMETDATATITKPDRLGEALRDALPQAEELNKELSDAVDRVQKSRQGGEGKSRKAK